MALALLDLGHASDLGIGLDAIEVLEIEVVDRLLRAEHIESA